MFAPPSPESRPAAIGAVLAGKYEVKRLIGKGGMGSVYEGLHVEIGKRVAIKLLETEHSRAEEIAARFRREGRAASRVESDHVVQVFDVGEDPVHGLYMVMEFLVGEDLAARLEREKLLDVPVALDIAWQAARGLAKAHAAGVIHRDLKPGNIFLAQRDDGSTVVKLVDFGISKLIVEAEGPRSEEAPKSSEPRGAITRHGSAVGTPQYMSPEQAQGHPIDHRADVWALGAVLYEMLSGKQAYELLENYEQTIFAIVLRKPPPLAEVAPWVPASVIDIVQKALEHDLPQRIADCGVFARMLSEVAKSGDVGARPSAPNAPLALMRRTTGSNDNVVVITPGHAPVISRATSAETAPMMNAFDSKSEPRIAISPPGTVTGVSVKTGAHDSLEPDEPQLEAPRRSSKVAVVAVLLLGLVAAAAAFVMIRGNPLSPNSGAATGAEPTGQPAVSASPSVEVYAAPSVTASASAAPVVSASASAKPVGKPLKNPKPVASASAAPSGKPAGDDQFGGTGLSTSF